MWNQLLDCGCYPNYFDINADKYDQLGYWDFVEDRINPEMYPVCNFQDHARCVSILMQNQRYFTQSMDQCVHNCHALEKKLDSLLVNHQSAGYIETALIFLFVYIFFARASMGALGREKDSFYFIFVYSLLIRRRAVKIVLD